MTDESWSKEQAWLVVKALHNQAEVRYESLLFSPEFHGDEPALHALQRAGLISIVRRTEPMAAPLPPSLAASLPADSLRGTRQKLYVRPARPVFREAFRRLVTDANLGSGIELLLQEQRDGSTAQSLSRSESELREVLQLMAAARANSEGAVAEALRGRAMALATDIRQAAEDLQASREKCGILRALTSHTPPPEPVTQTETEAEGASTPQPVLP